MAALACSILLLQNAKARTIDQAPVGLMAAGLLQPAPLALRSDSGEQVADGPDSTNTTAEARVPQVPLNAAARKFVDAYIEKNGEVLQKVADRSAPVFRIMEPILEKYDLPVELKYLAVVESDLVRTAVSRVGAAGPWQLMPGTARDLGLHVSRKWDERKHFSKSTTAAAKYLRDLYRYYDDWLLVIAAYNAGPLTVDRAIRRAGSRNFWKIQGFLPAETRGHVKRFIGTHYFFESCGSATTLTKAETATYQKAIERFQASLQTEVVQTKVLATTLQPVNAIAAEAAPAPTAQK